jgi:sugar/nucleoside kinase (ribokinase family)
MFDVISIGATTVDILVKPEEMVLEKEWLKIERSSKSEIGKWLICSGGGASNSAVAMRRLGLKSACVSQAGKDLLREYINRDLDEAKVDRTMMAVARKEGTDFSVILVSYEGSRSILVKRGKERLEERDIRWGKIKKTKWFYISSLEGNMDLLEKLIGAALENGIKVAVNPGNRELKQRGRLIPLLSQVDFLLLNKAEAEILTEKKMKEERFWKRLMSFGAKIIAVTNGRKGAHVIEREKHIFSPIINTKVMDETGAGDAFGSAVVAGLIYGKRIEEALEWGMKNSASVVRFLGAKEGLLKINKLIN